MDTATTMLRILDQACETYAFPMLDNGYWYLAATRRSVFRSPSDWAFVFEIFGYSPRYGWPDVHVQTFASRLHDRDPRTKYASDEAYQNYLAVHPHDESRSFLPIEDGDWKAPEYDEMVASEASEIVLRGQRVRLPTREEYGRTGISLESEDGDAVFELARYLAAHHRDLVLATPAERRVSVLPEMSQLLCLDEWNHPDVVQPAEQPSGSEAFQQLARVLETGDVRHYAPTMTPNTHWSNWPAGGSL